MLKNTPKISLMMSTRSFILWRLLLVRRPSLPLTNSKMWPKRGTSNGGTISLCEVDPGLGRCSKKLYSINYLLGISGKLKWWISSTFIKGL